MRKVMVAMVVLVAAAGLLLAQSNQYSETAPSGVLSGCPGPAQGSNILCSVTDGFYQSSNGAAYQKVTTGTVSGGIVGGSCPSGQYMTGISATGVPTCAVLPGIASPTQLSCGTAVASGNSTGGVALALSSCK